MLTKHTIQNYSKRYIGSFRLIVKYIRIFTDIPNSQSQQWRQQNSRFTIHARTELTSQGISLPQNHGAVVNPGFHAIKLYNNASSPSTGQASDLIHHNSIQQSPVFLLNSRYSLFSASYFIKIGIPSPSFVSYGINLQSSFTTII